MKKIRESFHMIAAAVFCLVMSVKATVLKEMGQAVGLSGGSSWICSWSSECGGKYNRFFYVQNCVRT